MFNFWGFAYLIKKQYLCIEIKNIQLWANTNKNYSTSWKMRVWK